MAPRGSIFKSQGKKEADSGGSLTPSKVASLRSTYIQQIKDLHSLKEAGAISDDHFVKQRDVLLSKLYGQIIVRSNTRHTQLLVAN